VLAGGGDGISYDIPAVVNEARNREREIVQALKSKLIKKKVFGEINEKRERDEESLMNFILLLLSRRDHVHSPSASR
jgi:hypothetical protein